MPIEPEQMIQLYRMMVRIRTFEETVLVDKSLSRRTVSCNSALTHTA